MAGLIHLRQRLARIFAGPLPGSASTYTWDGLTAATQHYVRVNQQLPNGSWDPSRAFSLMTIGCGGGASAPATPSAGATLVLLGFSPSFSGGSPPPDLVRPGGSLLTCNPLYLYAFVQVVSLPAPADFFVTWLVNSTPVPKAPVTVLPGTSIFVVPYPLDTNVNPSARYTLRLSTKTTGPPELEGGFTVAC